MSKEKKQQKRDEKGRFVGEGMSMVEHLGVLECELQCAKARIAFLEGAAEYYKNEVKKLGHNLDQADKSSAFAIDALHEAYLQVEWYRSKLPWWKKWLHRDKILDYEIALDKMVSIVIDSIDD